MDNRLNFEDLANKLFCTFTQENLIEDIISDLSYKYTILYNKIFVLETFDIQLIKFKLYKHK